VIAGIASRSPVFTVPRSLEAETPPERRGVERDNVRLLVATGTGLTHRRFRELPAVLDAGDLVVLNTSATVAAALEGRGADGRATILHVATQLDDGDWVVEVRRADGDGPDLTMRAGAVVRLPGPAELTLTAPYPDSADPPGRLWRATIDPRAGRVDHLAAHGRPIRYGHARERRPLSDYQNVYADEPGSAEMASAGRPFTPELLVRLMAAEVTVAHIVLHAGVSSPEAHEAPAPERFRVPASTARLVAATRAGGGRVIAVGTTVVRALESAALADGRVSARSGWTDLVLGPSRPARVVSGLVTGLHLPQSSHLQLLQAVAGSSLVSDAYGEALTHRYLWHEFGDSMLLLP
jgi:S-adenosylmethionine:tRNA ribosyltransferase-isomerase